MDLSADPTADPTAHLLVGSMGIFLSAIAPVFIIALYIYFRDKYEKEPLILLAKALALGMLTVIPIFFIERFLMGVMPPIGRVGGAFYQAFVVAAGTEEVFKFLALYLLIWKSPSFNEQFDGIVYAVYVSLGFAAVENVMYVMDGGYETAALRALTAVPAHAIFGITMGYFFGIARRYGELRKGYMRRALLVPILIHGLYDFILMVGSSWLLLLFVPYVIYLYIAGGKKLKILSEASIFRPENRSEQ
ncbi:MAG: PrsW family glutamic-type intramembrane protease [Bacteroides sp.]|nr:PrsW family glutamic-type intramembrane protease [Bacteroides sp.]